MSDLSSVLTAEAETCQAHSILYRVKLNCVPNDFVRRRFVLVIFVIRAEMAYTLPIRDARARACAFYQGRSKHARVRLLKHTRAFPRSTLFLPLRNEATPNKILWYTVHVYNTSNNISILPSNKLQLQRRIKLHIEIVNLKPMSMTTILFLERHASCTCTLALAPRLLLQLLSLALKCSLLK